MGENPAGGVIIDAVPPGGGGFLRTLFHEWKRAGSGGIVPFRQ
jgi:hypothetical protein